MTNQQKIITQLCDYSMCHGVYLCLSAHCFGFTTLLVLVIDCLQVIFLRRTKKNAKRGRNIRYCFSVTITLCNLWNFNITMTSLSEKVVHIHFEFHSTFHSFTVYLCNHNMLSALPCLKLALQISNDDALKQRQYNNQLSQQKPC